MGRSWVILLFLDHRMLGFEGALCAVRYSGFGYSSLTTWMNYVNCNGHESALDFCYYQGLEGSRPYCSRYHNAGVVCRSGEYTY